VTSEEGPVSDGSYRITYQLKAHVLATVDDALAINLEEDRALLRRMALERERRVMQTALRPHGTMGRDGYETLQLRHDQRWFQLVLHECRDQGWYPEGKWVDPIYCSMDTLREPEGTSLTYSHTCSSCGKQAHVTLVRRGDLVRFRIWETNEKGHWVGPNNEEGDTQ
jgi:hypothetical protein